MASHIADVSHWWAQIHPRDNGPLPRRASLSGSTTADVCIVGAGYTGLWTAYELLLADPSLDVVVLEAEVAGFGASGRNGGAVIAQFNGSRDFWAKQGGGRQAAIDMERAIQASVDEVGIAVEREGIDCSFAKNGVLMAARTPLEAQRFQASIEEDRAWGFGPDDSTYLDAAALRERIDIAGAIGARFSPHCASIHAGRLVRGLADVVERHGGVIHEDSPVTEIAPGVARTAVGEVRAKFVVRATEAYTDTIKGLERQLVPVMTSMIATVPLTAEQQRAIGWGNKEALLAEHPFLHLQHTADGRITIGGDDPRIPYLYGSKPLTPGRPAERLVEHYRKELARLFPPLDGIGVENAWHGVFAAPRDWAPSVGVDRETGLAWGGGYVGEGVAGSNLAGRTLRDLLLGRETELTKLPWVRRTTRKWEPEPLRFIGAAGVWAMRAAGDRGEARTGKPSRMWELGNKIAGFTGHLG